ncbi:MAG TPA: serine protease, partial [Anaeromyxobacter sp.]|nr:serine protease [Anaeromyxobacter sp.]
MKRSALLRPVAAGARAALALLAAVGAAGSARASDAPASAGAPAPSAATSPVAARAPYCSGEYADDLAALAPEARALEQARPGYTFCLRTSAVYECPSYAGDGSLRRTRKRVVAHGTAFGLRRDGQDTLVVTNEHVASWPAVTDADHVFDDVPPGCRKISEALKLVENEADDYPADDIPLTHVVGDPQLDVAVLRAHQALPVVPWKIGRSAGLRERNAVDVHGFPLGVIRTTNVGKVTSAWEHDDEREWDHDDFVVDALLSPGNSGSPVFAVSCRTGEFELVGVYHAGWVRGSALNAVVGVDELRPLLDTLKRSPRAKSDTPPLDATARGRAAEVLRGGLEIFFPFGATSAAVRLRADGALLYQVMGKDFPVRSQPALVLEDLPPGDPASFGRPGRAWAGIGWGLRELDRTTLDAEAQAQLAKLLEGLRHDGTLATSFRAAAGQRGASRQRFDEARRLERGVRRLATVHQDLA